MEMLSNHIIIHIAWILWTSELPWSTWGLTRRYCGNDYYYRIDIDSWPLYSCTQDKVRVCQTNYVNRCSTPCGNKRCFCSQRPELRYQIGKCVPVCDIPCDNGRCTSPNQCTCYPGFTRLHSSCRPHCSTCINGDCVSPDRCECHKGYTAESPGNCQPVCDPPCINGLCSAPNYCTCAEGYSLNHSSWYQCDPNCSTPCDHGECIAPETCACHEGYTKEATGICEPVCDPPCINGLCSVPNNCTCLEGYSLNHSSWYRCDPYCSTPCDHGDCIAPETCKCHEGYTKEATGICEPVCDPPCINGLCSAPNYCTCSEGYSLNNSSWYQCDPYCSTPCDHGDCIAPETCTCHEGYTKEATGICEPVCDPPCINGLCSGPNYCTCSEGYSLNKPSWYQCDPYCSTPCDHGDCIAPETCTCHEGYIKEATGICEPVCDPPCINGFCLAPNNCTCSEGYSLNNSSWYQCDPYCSTPCDHGDCIAPETCTCHEGYTKEATGICEPVCDPPCIHGLCLAPNNCTCSEGYSLNNSSWYQCDPYCSTPCDHGECIAPETCTCHEGYTKEATGICEPVCDPPCINGSCSEPNVCVCKNHMVKSSPFQCIHLCADEEDDENCLQYLNMSIPLVNPSSNWHEYGMGGLIPKFHLPCDDSTVAALSTGKQYSCFTHRDLSGQLISICQEDNSLKTDNELSNFTIFADDLENPASVEMAQLLLVVQKGQPACAVSLCPKSNRILSLIGFTNIQICLMSSLSSSKGVLTLPMLTYGGALFVLVAALVVTSILVICLRKRSKIPRSEMCDTIDTNQVDEPTESQLNISVGNQAVKYDNIRDIGRIQNLET